MSKNLVVYFSNEDNFCEFVLKYMSNTLCISFDKYLKYNENTYFVKTNTFLYLKDEDIKEDFEKLGIIYANIIVVSKHKSAHNNYMFCTHYTGNFIKNDFGGESKKLSIPYIDGANRLFNLLNNKNYTAFYEATHHGPTINYPAFFFELGPNQDFYSDNVLIKSYVDILLEFINSYSKEIHKDSFILIGSGHYIDLNSLEKIKSKVGDLHISHIIPKYIISELIEDKNLLKEILIETIKKSKSKVIFVDKSYVKKFSLIIETLKELEKEFGLEIKF